MSGSGAPPAPGLSCPRCQAPFGTAVAFCPFCGADQAVSPAQKLADAQKLAEAQKRANAQKDAEARKLAEARSLAAAQALGAQIRQGSVPPVPPAPQVDDEAPPPLQPGHTPQNPWWKRRRRRVVLGLAGLVAAYLLLRSGPSGTLIVYPSPAVAGSVTVDGDRAGPPGERLKLAAGVHRLGFDADGWTAAVRDVTIVAQEQRVVTIVLAPKPASITFDVQPPGATLRLDGRPVDAAQASMEVAPGRHRIVASHPGFATFILEPVLGRGEQRRIPMTLSPLVVREVTLTAPVTGWSEPVPLPPHTSFTVAAGGRLRLRVGSDSVLVQAGAQLNLGDVRGQSLQAKAVGGEPVEVHVFLKPDG